MSPALAATGTPRRLWDRMLRRNTPSPPPLVITHLGPTPPSADLINTQAFHTANGFGSSGPLPRLNFHWPGQRFNTTVKDITEEVEQEVGTSRSRGFAEYAMGMMEITKLCGYLRGWRIGCAPIYIEETTNLVALEACRAAMRGSPELSSIGQLLREVNCLDPLDVGRAGRPRLFAWFRLLMHLTHVWETLARIDPAGQVACTRSFTQDPSGAMRLQSNRLEKVLDSGRALNGIAAAFGGSLGIIMLLPETFTTCVHIYGSRPLMAFYTRLALRIPQLVEFSSLLEQQVLCAIKTREQLNDKIRLFEDLSLGVEPRMIPIADMFRTLTPPRRRVAFEMPPPDAGAGLGITSG